MHLYLFVPLLVEVAQKNICFLCDNNCGKRENSESVTDGCSSSIHAVTGHGNTYSALMDILVLADKLMAFYSVTDYKHFENAIHNISTDRNPHQLSNQVSKNK